MSREEPESAEAEAGEGPFPSEPGGDEPPGKDPDRPPLPPLSSRYFTSLAASLERLQQHTQDILSRINDSREEDHTVLSSFRESLLRKVSELAEQLEERLFHRYGFQNARIQERLQALAEVMESVEELQEELRPICCTVEAAYQELCLQPEV